ncbi:MAG: ATP-binding cassette domain-containing protein, partial [Thermoplasmata archaeon]|nr:ATP-binding cassette domain-containing protein [Thermoplasmata archaeon]
MGVIADSLAKKYPNGVWGTKNVSFEARKGEITVLLGPNGAGKTTTVGMLATLLKPTRGDARILGYSTRKDVWKVR